MLCFMLKVRAALQLLRRQQRRQRRRQLTQFKYAAWLTYSFAGTDCVLALAIVVLVPLLVEIEN